MANAAQLTQAPIALSINTGVCDLSQRAYFSAIVNSNTAFTFINRPADRMIFELEVALVSGTLSWPSNIRWVGGIAPQGLQLNRIHLFQFRRPQSTGSDEWLGSYLPNF